MNFTDLEVWKEAREMRNQALLISRSFPEDERYRLCDQIIRASRSVGNNIAEGHGRYHLKENIHFCRLARGSLSETMDHWYCAYDSGYIDNMCFHEQRQRVERLYRLLNGYIAYLKKQL